MLIHFIASDTGKEYKVDWYNAVVIPYVGDNKEIVLTADFIPNVKCRWGTPSKVNYNRTTNELTVNEYTEETLDNLMKVYIEEGYKLL